MRADIYISDTTGPKETLRVDVNIVRTIESSSSIKNLFVTLGFYINLS